MILIHVYIYVVSVFFFFISITEFPGFFERYSYYFWFAHFVQLGDCKKHSLCMFYDEGMFQIINVKCIISFQLRGCGMIQNSFVQLRGCKYSLWYKYVITSYFMCVPNLLLAPNRLWVSLVMCNKEGVLYMYVVGVFLGHFPCYKILSKMYKGWCVYIYFSSIRIVTEQTLSLVFSKQTIQILFFFLSVWRQLPLGNPMVFLCRNLSHWWQNLFVIVSNQCIFVLWAVVIDYIS